MKRRDDLMTMIEILINADIARKPTPLMTGCNLSYVPFMELVNRLLKIGLLELLPGIKRDGRSKVRYRTTDEGRKFANEAMNLYQVIEDNYIKKRLKEIRAV